MMYYPNDEEIEELIMRLSVTWERYSMYAITDDIFIRQVERAMRKAGIIDD
tara:strand:+ start:572 stop:724 length:153 start_codon:yes stop_codon:yes gene_type:complete